MANVEDVEGEGSVQGNGPPQFNDQPNFRTLREYLHPARQSTPSCIILPLNQQAFNLKPGMIQLLPTFHGMDSENPYIHIKDFEEVCNTFIDRTCTEETIRLKLFPFSLKDKAKLWLNSLRPRSIGTWREMQAEFLKKYFPTHRTAALQRQMMNFSCSPNESFHQAWERFKDLLNACPHHGFEMWRLVSFFYDSLTADFKRLVSTMCNGEFYDKEPSEAFDFFDQLAENIKQWETSLPLHVESRNTISHSSGKF